MKKNYLLVIVLTKILFSGRREVHIPFAAKDSEEAKVKTKNIIDIWDEDVFAAKLFELREIEI